MIVLENTCAEVTSRQYINSVVKEEQTIWICRPSAICGDVFCSNWVTRESQEDVLMQCVQIHDCSCTERRKKKNSSLYRSCKLFLSEDRFEVVKVDYGIASIPLFRIDIPLSSKSIQFGAKMTRTESDNKIELRKILGPLHLPLDQHLGSRKILKVYIICNNINGIGWTFQIVSPNLESFKDSKQFLVMYVVIQLYHSKSIGVKRNQMNFIIFINNGEDCSESIVQGISFHNELCQDR